MLSSDPRESTLAREAGPSAGQTAIIVIIDLVLGTQHRPQLASFQADMRRCTHNLTAQLAYCLPAPFYPSPSRPPPLPPALAKP